MNRTIARFQSVSTVFKPKSGISDFGLFHVSIPLRMPGYKEGRPRL